MPSIVYSEEGYRIQGAIFEVYGEKGCGFVEPAYQECLEKELKLQNIPFVAQPELRSEYKGEPLEQTFKPDLVCFDLIIVELKAVRELTPNHEAQVLNYLKATEYEVGLILNFGPSRKKIKRLVFDNDKKTALIPPHPNFSV